MYTHTHIHTYVHAYIHIIYIYACIRPTHISLQKSFLAGPLGSEPLYLKLNRGPSTLGPLNSTA